MSQTSRASGSAPLDGADVFQIEAVEKLSLGEHIARHIQGLLVSGQIHPGDYLPSQRELAARYGTSVAAVREAISILSAAGVLDARPGRGTVVLPVSQQSPSINLWMGVVHNEAEALAFLDTRRLLEHYTIAHAVTNASSEQRDGLVKLLEKLRQTHADPEAFVQADLQLHHAIAQAAGNPVVLRLLEALRIPLANVMRAAIGELMGQGHFDSVYAVHEDIVGSILTGKVSQATDAFDRMLAQTIGDGALGRALGRPEDAEPPLGPEFLEDLHWNLTRLIGPMADVLIPETAAELGLDVANMTRGHLGRYLPHLSHHLPTAKRDEWRALSELLLRRYAPD